MRSSALRCLSLALPLLTLAAVALDSARAAEPELGGNWKLLAIGPLHEEPIMIVEAAPHGGQANSRVTSSRFPQTPQVSKFESRDGEVTMAFGIGSASIVFTGRADKDGSIKGRLRVGDRGPLARLEKTKDRVLSPPPQDEPPVIQAYRDAVTTKDAKARHDKLRGIIAGKPGSPMYDIVYTNLISEAEEAKTSADDVRKLVEEWVGGAKAYGADAAEEARTSALSALSGQKPYAALALELARQADAALKPGSALQTRADVARALASAADLAGDAAVAKEAKARSDKLEAQLDDDYRKRVPPFKPEAEAGPKDRKSDRVVLLELFTGAECPPCVAADVAFDALGTSYAPSQLVRLQYHLHIPRPDPLTNPDTTARADYYPDLGGTPGTYFDGQGLASGGGPLAGSKGKYDEYRGIVDERLAKPADASIELKADRRGDTVTIRASAQAKGERKAKDAARVGGSKLRLRLALVEDEVRYVGGNSLRFHHHVVRALPGGVDGAKFSDGGARVETTVNLAELRKSLEKSLSDFARETAKFPRALPPIPLEKLSVVAFVQDEGDKDVLNAAIVRIEESK
jgi:hypothetical protein